MVSSAPQRPWVVYVIVLMLLVALTPLFLSSQGNATTIFGTQRIQYDGFQPPSAADLQGREIVRVGVYILGAGMLSFLLKENEARDRITLSSSTLASAIFYHMTLTASVPPVRYLTYADRFMILNYIFIATQLFVAITLFQLQRPDNDTPENKRLSSQIHTTTRWMIPLGWMLSLVTLHLATFGL